MRRLAAALLLVAGAAHAGSVPLPPVASTETSIRVERPAGMKRSTLRLRRVLDEDSAAAKDAETLPDTDGTPLLLAREVILDESDVTAIFLQIDPDLVHYEVELHFSDAAAKRLAAATHEGLGIRLAFVIDGKVASAPRVMSPLSSTAMIAGRFTEAQGRAWGERLAP